MPQSIDWPPARQSRPGRPRQFFLILLALAILLFGTRAALSYYVDLLWFKSLGYENVFWKTLTVQWGVFAAVAAATFIIFYGSFLALKRAHLDDLPDGHTIFIGTQPVKLPVEPVLKFIALVASLAIALVSAATLTSEWQTLALFWYAPHTSEVIDPIFGKPVNFYLFALPAWEIDRRLAAHLGGHPLSRRRFLPFRERRGTDARRAPQPSSDFAMARIFHCIWIPFADPRCEYISQPVRSIAE